MDTEQLKNLMHPEAFPHAAAEVQLIETHISWVVLAGEFAYKIKKPIRNSFLDYTTQEARRRYCEAELRLNKRFAPELYIDVVPITIDGGSTRVAGRGVTIETAVRMHRFAAEALMSERLAAERVTTRDVRLLAARVARFHQHAEPASSDSRFGSPEEIYTESLDNFRELSAAEAALELDKNAKRLLSQIQRWTMDYFTAHREQFELRKQQGHVRECHGDLHLGNVVWWRGEFVPFDGIEFNDEFRWIDTLSDAAFTAMDLAARDHLGLAHSFQNAYLETSGDYAATRVFQWYVVFRAMVRAKVAGLRAMQLQGHSAQREASLEDLRHHLDVAHELSRHHPSPLTLWITHGVSGSGKTTGSEAIVQRHGAIRVRADVERKKLGIAESDLYSVETTLQTYQRLAQLAEQLLRSGEKVIVDATFLMKSQRTKFRELADRLKATFAIVHFEADRQTLQCRIQERASLGLDVSDADGAVLESQLASEESLDDDERRLCVDPAEFA